MTIVDVVYYLAKINTAAQLIVALLCVLVVFKAAELLVRGR